ncbi:DUF4406 domain-containing protein [Flavobacterium sp. IMCC34518]|uniref:DUF4406 domain-containing protein n=1 Tax=Flavobacterium sp. IMCC34518 TaxID=3003623 RepID=UPI002482366A|nr:DUF4406 domain-containing protein [Flavobacterium sp. IMCC34518]
MIKKIYIAGKVTGLPFKEVAVKFCTTATQIKELGLEFVNPVELVQNNLFGDAEIRQSSEREIWVFAMKKCINAILECDGVILHDDWMRSKGAKLEVEICDQLGIPTFNNLNDLQEWNNSQRTEPKAKK